MTLIHLTPSPFSSQDTVQNFKPYAQEGKGEGTGYVVKLIS